ncbi:hypothetical protein BV22DRAFT_480826 [Leucogyrophana mollusca]|uniref:Uncharacterized protein n=1 Tax=Leucogyrophana mollusca TaxID=85980 RepID=A0ACB8BHJ0_9AGAM|nr:hypothetical protein BV22DRAFT_480826 [Leucogyrophana mollusca]
MSSPRSPGHAGPSESGSLLHDRRGSYTSSRTSASVTQMLRDRRSSDARQTKRLQYTIERSDVPWTPVTRPAPLIKPTFTAPASGPSYAQRLYASAFSNKPLLDLPPDIGSPPRLSEIDTQSTSCTSTGLLPLTIPVPNIERGLLSPQSPRVLVTHQTEGSASDIGSTPVIPSNVSPLGIHSYTPVSGVTMEDPACGGRPRLSQILSHPIAIRHTTRPASSYQPLASPSSIFYAARPLERSMSMVTRSLLPHPEDLSPSPSVSFLNLEPTENVDASRVTSPFDVSATGSSPPSSDERAEPSVGAEDGDDVRSTLNPGGLSRLPSPCPPQYETLLPPRSGPENTATSTQTVTRTATLQAEHRAYREPLVYSPSSSRSATPEGAPAYTIRDPAPLPLSPLEPPPPTRRIRQRNPKPVSGPRPPSRPRHHPSISSPTAPSAPSSIGSLAHDHWAATPLPSHPPASTSDLTREEPPLSPQSATLSDPAHVALLGHSRSLQNSADEGRMLPVSPVSPAVSTIYTHDSSSLSDDALSMASDTSEEPQRAVISSSRISPLQPSRPKPEHPPSSHPIPLPPSSHIGCPLRSLTPLADPSATIDRGRQAPTALRGSRPVTPANHSSHPSHPSGGHSIADSLASGADEPLRDAASNDGIEEDDVISELINDLVSSMGLLMTRDLADGLVDPRDRNAAVSPARGDDSSEPIAPAQVAGGQPEPVSLGTYLDPSQPFDVSQLQDGGQHRSSYPHDAEHLHCQDSELYQGRHRVSSERHGQAMSLQSSQVAVQQSQQHNASHTSHSAAVRELLSPLQPSPSYVASHGGARSRLGVGTVAGLGFTTEDGSSLSQINTATNGSNNLFPASPLHPVKSDSTT